MAIRKMKLSEYATYMHVCYRTVYRWVKSGKLKVEKTPGGTYLVVIGEKENGVS